MSSRLRFKKKAATYYLLDTATQKYLSASFDWNDKGAKIADSVELQKKLRRLAELEEEARRPKDWLARKHTYTERSVATFLPESLVVVDDTKQPLFTAQTIGAQMTIPTWEPTN